MVVASSTRVMRSSVTALPEPRTDTRRGLRSRRRSLSGRAADCEFDRSLSPLARAGRALCLRDEQFECFGLAIRGEAVAHGRCGDAGADLHDDRCQRDAFAATLATWRA